MSEKWIQISRDPFAREDLVRRTVETNATCSFCGCKRGSGKLFEYAIDPDSVGPGINPIKGLYCSIGCMQAYHY